MGHDQTCKICSSTEMFPDGHSTHVWHNFMVNTAIISSGLCLISANKEFGIFDTFLDSFMEFTVTSRVTKYWNTYINARLGVGSQNCTYSFAPERSCTDAWNLVASYRTEHRVTLQKTEPRRFKLSSWWVMKHPSRMDSFLAQNTLSQVIRQWLLVPGSLDKKFRHSGTT